MVSDKLLSWPLPLCLYQALGILTFLKHMVASWISLWDVSRGNFCDCEKVPLHKFAKVDEIVVVTPFRYREQTMDLFRIQMLNLHKLITAFQNFSENFVNLQLHHVGYLTVKFFQRLPINIR